MRNFISKFCKDQQGITATEFTLVVTVFLMLIFGIIDFSRLMWEVNMLEKATQWGVRTAIVSEVVAEGLESYDGVPAAGGSGLPVPASAVNGGNPIVCTSSGAGSASCTGGFGPTDPAAFTAIVTEQIQKFHDRVTHSEVVIEYQHIGLGFAGNPIGLDIAPAVTVRIQNLPFVFVTPGLAGLVNMTLPTVSATLTGEDLG